MAYISEGRYWQMKGTKKSHFKIGHKIAVECNKLQYKQNFYSLVFPEEVVLPFLAFSW